MKNKKHKFLLSAIVLILVLALPITIYLARTQQLFRPKAAFGQVAIHLVPLEVTKNIGEPFTVEVHANSGTIPVSAIKIDLAENMYTMVVQNIVPAIGPTEGFTDLIWNKNEDPFTFTVISRKPTASLPTGSFKLATLTIIPFQGGTGPFGVDAVRSEAVGFNGTSEDVALSIVEGTKTNLTVNGTVCRVNQCVAPQSIATTPQLRPDNKYNVALTFSSTEESAKFFKVYRNTGAAIPEGHPESNLAGVTSSLIATGSAILFVDTNNGAGYAGETNLHYDIDGFALCGLPATTVTPTTTTTTPTTTIAPTTTPSPTPSG